MLLEVFLKRKIVCLFCVPFGMFSAPRLFTKPIITIFAWFRQQNIRCSYYINDSLNTDSNLEICASNRMIIVKTLVSLSFKVKKKTLCWFGYRDLFFGFVYF